MMVIESRENARFKALQKLLFSSRNRRHSGHAVVEGWKLIAAAQVAGVPLACVVASQSTVADDEGRKRFESIRCGERIVLSDRLANSLSELPAPPGILATFAIPRPSELPADKSCLLLDGIQDPGNVGTILRVAAATGLRHVAMSSSSASAWSPKSLRSAMGAHFLLDILEGQDLKALANKHKGIRVATAPGATASIFDAAMREPVMWMFGSEGQGLSSCLLAMADVTVHIPMPGGTESLNVASAAAVCLYEGVRRKLAGHGEFQ